MWGLKLLKDSKNNKTSLNEVKSNAFIEPSCQKGDLVYFGIHDLSKYYRENGSLPSLSLFDIFDKKGEIVHVDPVSQRATLILEKTPFYFGYRKIESDRDKEKRYMRKDGKIEIKIPIVNLENMSSIMNDDSIPVYLVIDGNTKYQKNLMKALRRKELERIQIINQPSLPITRHYDNFEGENFSFDDIDDLDQMCYENFDPNINSKSRKWKYFNSNKKYKYY